MNSFFPTTRLRNWERRSPDRRTGRRLAQSSTDTPVCARKLLRRTGKSACATLFLLAAPFLSTTPIALSQTVRWNPASGTLAKDQTTQLQLVFKNCQRAPKTPIIFPKSTTFTLSCDYYGFIFGYVVTICPTSDTPITIPAFKIETDKGEITVPAAHFYISADIKTVTIPPIPRQQQTKTLAELLRDARNSQTPASAPDQTVTSGLTAPVPLAADKTFPPATNTPATNKPSPDYLNNEISIWNPTLMSSPPQTTQAAEVSSTSQFLQLLKNPKANIDYKIK